MKQKINQEEIDLIVQQKMKEYEKQFIEEHKANISMKHGNTYISFKKYDHVTEKLIKKLEVLFDLMQIEFTWSFFGKNFDQENDFVFYLEKEDKERAEFIQKFINNGYKLTWR